MKKTLTVNLNNTVYAEYDAAKDEQRDIEARIAELFKERMRFGMQIITVREVDEIISVMGHPEDFASDTLNIEIDDKEVGEKEVENQNTEKGMERHIRKKFPRETDGVCLGIRTMLFLAV